MGKISRLNEDRRVGGNNEEILGGGGENHKIKLGELILLKPR